MPERLQQQSEKKETLRVMKSGGIFGLCPVLQEAMCRVKPSQKKTKKLQLSLHPIL
jgi:hypothetical protein